MTSLLNSLLLLERGIVLIDSGPSVVQRSIALRYNPDTLARSLQVGVVDRKSDQ